MSALWSAPRIAIGDCSASRMSHGQPWPWPSRRNWASEGRILARSSPLAGANLSVGSPASWHRPGSWPAAFKLSHSDGLRFSLTGVAFPCGLDRPVGLAPSGIDETVRSRSWVGDRGTLAQPRPSGWCCFGSSGTPEQSARRGRARPPCGVLILIPRQLRLGGRVPGAVEREARADPQIAVLGILTSHPYVVSPCAGEVPLRSRFWGQKSEKGLRHRNESQHRRWQQLNQPAEHALPQNSSWV